MHEIDLTHCDLNLLVAFEALMQEQHVGRAAVRLSLSQSATSHVLARLRTLLGDPLFVRHPRGIEPTLRARELAAPIKEALAQVRTIMTPPRPFNPVELRRAFTVGATDYAVFVVLAPLVAELQNLAPNLDLRIVPVDRASVAAGFDSGTLDFALGSFPSPPHRIEAVPLFEERFVGIARRDHPALGRGRMSIDRFVATPHALVSLSGDPCGSVDEALSTKGLRRRVAVTVAHFLALPFVVGASSLLGVLAERAATLMTDTAGLALFSLPIELPTWSIHLLRSRQLRTRPEVAWFSDLVVEAKQNYLAPSR